MNGFLKIIGSNNQILPVGAEYNNADLIINKLIINSRIKESLIGEPILEEKVLTLDIKNVNIFTKHIHVDAWFVNEEHNGGRAEFKLYWT
ncbi:MAG: hypothetical protein H8E55_63975 [Pelagibacterales bacterium]|nr:hypothetical protein [Pelagibacterales bacterium]